MFFTQPSQSRGKIFSINKGGGGGGGGEKKEEMFLAQTL